MRPDGLPRAGLTAPVGRLPPRVRFRLCAERSGGAAPYQAQRHDSRDRQREGGGQGEPGATPVSGSGCADAEGLAVALVRALVLALAEELAVAPVLALSCTR